MSSVIVGAAGRRCRRHRSPADSPVTVLDKHAQGSGMILAARDATAVASYLDTCAVGAVATTTATA